jgi:carboxymethylenebutenolidase
MYAKTIVDVLGSPMDVLLFEPAGKGPFPGLVAMQHLPISHEDLEIDPFTVDVGDRLAAAGYAVAIPHVFHWWPRKADPAIKREGFRDDWVVADMKAALATLLAGGTVDRSRLGILGHCWGGRLSWLGACHMPEFKAMATLYGGRIKAGMGEGSPPAIDLAPRMRCAVLGIFGKEDANPSPADVKDMDAALTRAGIAHDFHSYDGAGHGFQDFHNPERYRKQQSDDAWKKLIAFFDRTLKG